MPTDVFQPANGEDAYVRQNNPDTNYQNAVLATGRTGAVTNPDVYRSLERIPFSLPNYIKISHAVLTLRRSTNESTRTIALHLATAGWTASTVTWNTQPSHASSGDAKTSGSNQDVDWDVTAHVKDWYAGATNNGWKLLGSESGSTYGTFNSSRATSYQPKLAVTYTLIVPDAPTLSPRANFDATTAAEFAWTHSHEAGLAQSAYRMQIVRVADGVVVFDSVKTASTAEARTLAANTLVNGEDYQWRAKTWDTEDREGPWSDYGTFNAVAPPTVDVTAPTEGEVVTTGVYTVEWAYSHPDEVQAAFRVRVVDGAGNVHTDTAKTAGGDATYGLDNLADGGSYTVDVWVWNTSDLQSPVSTRSFTVDYVGPPAPQVDLVIHEAFVRVEITNPPPGVGEPDATRNDVFRRRAATADDPAGEWVRTAVVDPNTRYDDYAVATDTAYQWRVRAVDEPGGTHSDSIIHGAQIDFDRGIYLHDPADPAGTLLALLYDRRRRDIDHPREVAYHPYVGHAAPTAEFGDQQPAAVTFDQQFFLDGYHARFQPLSRLTRLQALVGRTLCYRDARGRKLFGVIDRLPVTDEVYGATTSVVVNEVSHSEAV